MFDRRPGDRRRAPIIWAAVAVLLVAAGVLVIVLGSGRHAPGPPPVTSASPSTGSASEPAPAGHVQPMTRSAAVRLRIPAIGVDATVVALGLNADGSAGEPPLSQPYLVSWFKDGPAPGEIGPAAFYGHVDSARTGPAVFYRVGQLAPGSLVQVTRQDGTVATFAVYAVGRYPKAAFPTERVYGDTDGPEIRLITCGGSFDPAKGSYRDNIVTYGRLIKRG